MRLRRPDSRRRRHGLAGATGFAVVMNQTRSFLILALAFVAYLLFNQWMNDYHKPPAPPPSSASVASAASSSASVPAATDNAPAATSTSAQARSEERRVGKERRRPSARET